MAINIEEPITSLHEIRRFISDCFVAVGTSKENADLMALHISEADKRGFGAQGMNRLEMYLREIQSGLCDSKASPEIISETESTAWVDGKNGLGPVIGKCCMDIAIKKAKVTGIGWVTAKGCNNYGFASDYSMRALKEGMIGFTCGNTIPLVVPTGSTERALGTNPLSVAAPGLNDDSFIMDIAASVVCRGKIEIYNRKGEDLPEGWALNAQGEIETDPEKALVANRLLPLGGFEITGGYKGTGLGMVIEILSAIMSGAHFGPHVKHWGDTRHFANLGTCFFVINIEDFAPGFQSRLSDLMDSIRSMTPVDPDKPVLVPGDLERMYMAAVAEAGGVHYVPDQHKTCDELAKELNVKPLVSKLLM